MEWTNDLTIELLNEYKKRPELWNVNHDAYRITTAKYEAWQDMAAIFNCDVLDLRKKLNSVFASHRRERQKVRNGGVSNWFAYHHLSFLPTHLDDGKNRDSEIVEETIIEEHEEEEYLESEEPTLIHEEIIVKQEPSQNVFVRETPTRKAVRMQKPRNKCPKRRLHLPNNSNNNNPNLDNKILEAIKAIRRNDLSKKRDECDIFGEYIAKALRKHDERTRSMIKHAINNILFEQEMKKYSTHYQMISIVDENPLTLTEHLDEENETIMPDLNTSSSK